MQLTAVLAALAFSGAALASPAAPRNDATCYHSLYYGEQACKQYCVGGGTCSLEKGHENDNDYVCVCSDPNAPRCSGMYKGEAACQEGCGGTCTLLLLPWECTCPSS